MSILHDLKVRCEAAAMYVQATQAEWGALVVAEGHRYRPSAQASGIEYGGCMVVPPWVKVRDRGAHNRKDPEVTDPEAFASALLRKQGYADLARDEFNPRHAPLPNHRRRRWH